MKNKINVKLYNYTPDLSHRFLVSTQRDDSLQYNNTNVKTHVRLKNNNNNEYIKNLKLNHEICQYIKK